MSGNTLFLVKETDDYVLESTYNIPVYPVNQTVADQMDMPDAVVDYLPPASQYTNGGNRLTGIYGLYPEKSLTGNGEWSTPISLGNFGGYITYYYENAIQNDQRIHMASTLSCTVIQTAEADFLSRATCWYRRMRQNWYTLAGSEHYDQNVTWDTQSLIPEMKMVSAQTGQTGTLAEIFLAEGFLDLVTPEQSCTRLRTVLEIPLPSAA